MPEPLATALGWLPYELALLVETLLKIAALLVPLLVTVAWYTYAERKIIGYMQVRLGPNRVGPKGWLQPVADAVKLLFKEFIIPAGANRMLFVAAPVISLASALAAWAVVPFSDFLVIADINAGLLYILAMTSLGVYGVIIAGLGVELEVRPARCVALRSADRGLRDRDGIRARRGADGRGEPQPARDRAGAGRRMARLVLAGRCCRCSWST